MYWGGRKLQRCFISILNQELSEDLHQFEIRSEWRICIGVKGRSREDLHQLLMRIEQGKCIGVEGDSIEDPY